MTEWSKVVDCKFTDSYRHRFESCRLQTLMVNKYCVLRKRINYITTRRIVGKLRDFSFYQKYRFLRTFRQKIYCRFQSNNLFFNTVFAEATFFRSYKFSAGLLSDYFGKKKKKKTYMLGFEAGFHLAERLNSHRIETLHLFFKGHGAQKRGVFQGMTRHPIFITKFIDSTPLAHNGTRPVSKRRL